MAETWPSEGNIGRLSKETTQLHKWARPAYEQGALPTLSLLPGEVTIRVLPGDEMYQAMEIEPEFMRPAILHGFGTNAKKRLPGRLTELAHFGWMPLAAALFGTVKWLPQWMHHNFLPVIGLRVHAKVAERAFEVVREVKNLPMTEPATGLHISSRAGLPPGW